MYSLDMASSADNLLGSLHGIFDCVTSTPNTRKPYAISISPFFALTTLSVSPSLKVSGRVRRHRVRHCLNICCYRCKLFPEDGGAVWWLSACVAPMYVQCRLLSFAVLLLNSMVRGHLGPLVLPDGELQVSLYSLIQWR